jgi:hypothetical protein
LRWNLFQFVLRHEFFEQHALVRGVLVNEIKSVGALRRQIRRADLTDESQQGNTFECGLFVAAAYCALRAAY